MAKDSDEERIRSKAHELWEAEGHPHGRDADHWAQAREIIAIRDSQTSTLLPRETGADDPVESQVLRDSYGDVPGLTDQGRDALTDIAREPGAASPSQINPMTSDAIMADVRANAASAPYAKSADKKGKTAAPIKAATPATTAAKVAEKPDAPVRSSKPASARTK